MMRYSRRYIDPDRRYRRWVDPRYRDLCLADIIAYLTSKGWKQVPTDRAHHLVFQEPDWAPRAGEPFEQSVPDAEDYYVYGLAIFDLITGIAELEQRQASAVIDDIVGAAGRNGAAADGAGKAGPAREVPTA